MFPALLNAEGFKQIISSFSNPKVANRFGAKGRSLRTQLSVKKKKKKQEVTPSGSSSRGYTRRSLGDRSNVGLKI